MAPFQRFNPPPTDDEDHCLWCGRRLPRFLGAPDQRGYMGDGFFDTVSCGWQFGRELARMGRRLTRALP